MKKGIDVSEWQGVIDWEKVKADGIQFAIIRAGYGKNNIDKQFERNIAECNRLSIPCGVYWFSYAFNEEMARREAQYCLEAINPYRVEYPVCFDFEYDSVKYAEKQGVLITKALATTIAEAFCDYVKNSGYYAINYANKDYLKNKFNMERLKKYDLWYAYWNSPCDRSDVAIWQYTSLGKVNGIEGRVDMNISYKDYPVIIREKGLNRLDKEVVVPPEDKIGEIEEGYVLKKGDNGTEVKKVQEMLLELGYALPKYGADGDFGGETETAINIFKKDAKLPQDGVVDIQTLLAMHGMLINNERNRIKNIETRLSEAKQYARNIVNPELFTVM